MPKSCPALKCPGTRFRRFGTKAQGGRRISALADFQDLTEKKALSILREFIAEALLSRVLDERPSEAPSMSNYLVIPSSRGLQS